MTNKGAALNKRVWTLFERAGFKTKPNSTDSSEEIVELSPGKKRPLDLLAVDIPLGVKIIGWNKTLKELKESLTVYVHDYEELRKLTKANGVLFVSTVKEVSEEDRNYAEQHNMRVWGEDELEYYESVVEAIGEYAKYEIIHSLGVSTTEETNIHHLLALRFSQPHSKSPTNLFLFTVTPDKLLKMCVIYRKAQRSGEAYQRMLRRSRLRSVAKFVSTEDALLPTDVIVHLNEAVSWEPIMIPDKDQHGHPVVLSKKLDCEPVILKVPLKYASLELIDGQHRLYGFVDTEPATRENFNLVVLGMADLPFEKRRDTFVAINDKSRRMDPNLVAYLKYTDDEAECRKNNELMAIKVAVELNKTTPFKDKIRLLDVGNQKITLKGFSGYDLKGLLGERGLLRKHHGNDSEEFVRALRTYFGILKDLFPKQWEHPEKYIIFTNQGISAFLKLLRSILRTHKGLLDAGVAKKYLKPLRDGRHDSDWEKEGLSKTYVGSQGWKEFHRDLVKTIREAYPHFEE